MDAHTMAAVAAGVSTRHYPRALYPLPQGMVEQGTSRSAVSRRFVALSCQRMHQFLSRPLRKFDLGAVYVDAKFFHEHCMLIALGVDCGGRKHVLGLREGSTENAAVTRALLADLVERGLSTERRVLFVIDGAKASRRAIAEIFGDRARVQRCQVYEQRNVLAHLPEHRHAPVVRCLRDAYHSESAELAERRLRNLVRSLHRVDLPRLCAALHRRGNFSEHPGTAASLREGLETTLTVLRLGLSGPLQRTLLELP